MSNDRELLEKAAKAAGIEGAYECWTGQGFKEGIRQVLNSSKCHRPWNPLTDDGDALRLAVKLRICFWIEGETEDEDRKPFAVATFHDHESVEYLTGVAPYAATRRAIVRAAAAALSEEQQP